MDDSFTSFTELFEGVYGGRDSTHAALHDPQFIISLLYVSSSVLLLSETSILTTNVG